MHQEVKDFIQEVKDRYPEMFKGKKVLECGSRDVNGSPREFFEDCDYTGIDLTYGKGVDFICSINEYLWGEYAYDKIYDVIICTEVMEHNRDYKTDWDSFWASLEDGGLVIMTCAGPKRGEHGTHENNPSDSPATLDFYKNMMKEDFKIPDDVVWHTSEYRRDNFDLFIAYKI